MIESWSLALALPGFRMQQESVRPDKPGAMLQAQNDRTHVIVSAFIERERKRDTVEACKKDDWGKASGSPLRKTEVHEVISEGLIAVHFRIPEFQGIRADQKNINACLSHDGTSIDIHLRT